MLHTHTLYKHILKHTLKTHTRYENTVGEASVSVGKRIEMKKGSIKKCKEIKVGFYRGEKVIKIWSCFVNVSVTQSAETFKLVPSDASLLNLLMAAARCFWGCLVKPTPISIGLMNIMNYELI